MTERVITEHLCTAAEPMPLAIADHVVELGQIWTHMDVEEIGETETLVFYHCLNCGHRFSLDLGD